VITLPRGDYTARSKRLHYSISVKRSSKYLTHLPYGFHRYSSRGFYHDFAYAHLAHLAWRGSFIALYPWAQHALLPPRTPLRLMAETTIAGIQPALLYYALTPHKRVLKIKIIDNKGSPKVAKFEYLRILELLY
jgi:hypothetical protein